MKQGWLKMPDATPLSVTYYFPKLGKNSVEKFPVLLEMLPYRKDDDFLERDYELCEYFARSGFVVARVDVRGTGSSHGFRPDREYSEQELNDAVEVIAQLGQKPWSNGKVGMYGISWGGFNAIQVAMKQPPALAAILATDATDDLYHDDIHFIDGIFHIDEYHLDIDHGNGLPASPHYATDANYFKERFNAEPWIFTYKQHQTDGPFWRNHSLRFQKEGMRVPAFLIGGLLDGYRDSVFRMLAKAEAPMKALIGPWNHNFPHDSDPGPTFEWRTQAVRWWNLWLRGEDTGILREPELTIFVRDSVKPKVKMHEIPGEWRLENWPISRKRDLSLFPQAEHRLGPIPGVPIVETLKYKPSAGISLGYWWGETTPDMAEIDKYALTFDSPPLENPLEIIGNPVAHLDAAASALLAHWVVRLEDVAPDGSVALVTGGALNGAQRQSRTKPQPLTPGVFYPLEVELHFTTWKFPAGHRVRMAVANGAFPMLWPSPYKMSTALRLGSPLTSLVLPAIPFEPRPSPLLEPVDPERSLRGVHSSDEHSWSFIPKLESRPGESTVVVAGKGEVEKIIGKLRIRTRETTRYSVNDNDPAQSGFLGTYEHKLKSDKVDLKLQTTMRVESDTGFFHIFFKRTLFEGAKKKAEKTWIKSIERQGQ